MNEKNSVKKIWTERENGSRTAPLTCCGYPTQHWMDSANQGFCNREGIKI